MGNPKKRSVNVPTYTLYIRANSFFSKICRSCCYILNYNRTITIPDEFITVESFSAGLCAQYGLYMSPASVPCTMQVYFGVIKI